MSRGYSFTTVANRRKSTDVSNWPINGLMGHARESTSISTPGLVGNADVICFTRQAARSYESLRPVAGSRRSRAVEAKRVVRCAGGIAGVAGRPDEHLSDTALRNRARHPTNRPITRGHPRPESKMQHLSTIDPLPSSSSQKGASVAHMASNALRISTFTLCLAALCSATAVSQVDSDVSSAATPAAAQAAYVYVGTTKGVYLYNAASNGSLSLVSGSPFSIAGSAVGSNGRYFFSLGTAYLRSYPVASNGAIKVQASQINTQLYSGSECGTAQALSLTTPARTFMCNSTVTRREGPKGNA